MKKNVFRIKEEVAINGNTILEKGDLIEVLSESDDDYEDSYGMDVTDPGYELEEPLAMDEEDSDVTPPDQHPGIKSGDEKKPFPNAKELPDGETDLDYRGMDEEYDDEEDDYFEEDDDMEDYGDTSFYDEDDGEDEDDLYDEDDDEDEDDMDVYDEEDDEEFDFEEDDDEDDMEFMDEDDMDITPPDQHPGIEPGDEDIPLGEEDYDDMDDVLDDVGDDFEEEEDDYSDEFEVEEEDDFDDDDDYLY